MVLVAASHTGDQLLHLSHYSDVSLPKTVLEMRGCDLPSPELGSGHLGRQLTFWTIRHRLLY